MKLKWSWESLWDLTLKKKLTLYHLRRSASPEQNDLIAEKEVHCYKQG